MFLNAIAAGHFVSAVEMAPNFAGTLLGISNTLAGGGMNALAPIVCGAFTNNNHTWAAWRTVFWITASVYLAGNMVYVATVRVIPQYWNNPQDNTDKDVQKKIIEL